MVANHKTFSLRLSGCCAAAVFLLTGCVSAEDSGTRAFRRFEQSSYLQSLWADTCSFPLIEENVVMLAAVDNAAVTPRLQCNWMRTPVGVGDTGVTLAEGITDLDARWFGCGEDVALPGSVWDAVTNPGSNLVHLGTGVSTGAQGAIVLAAKCHYWDDYYCTIKRGNPNCDFPNADQILSMAYAVFDPKTGDILW
jgi:hypothetical protein